MGLIQMKRFNLNNNESGLAPIIYVMVIGLIAVAGVGTYAYFTQPDVTYNVAEGGIFNIAGVEIDSLQLIAVVIGVILFIAMWYKGTNK